MADASTLEMALLGLLWQKPQSGYDLRKIFMTTAMCHYSDSPGSIYPALRRIESRGWIGTTGSEGGVAGSAGGASEGERRRRQEFAVTEAGKTVLQAWLEREVTRDDVTFRIPELMLRFAFMDGSLPRSGTVRFLDQLTLQLRTHVEDMRRKFRDMSGKAPSLHTGLLAFEAGIRGMETQLAWAQEVRARLAEVMP